MIVSYKSALVWFCTGQKPNLNRKLSVENDFEILSISNKINQKKRTNSLNSSSDNENDTSSNISELFAIIKLQNEKSFSNQQNTYKNFNEITFPLEDVTPSRLSSDLNQSSNVNESDVSKNSIAIQPCELEDGDNSNNNNNELKGEAEDQNIAQEPEKLFHQTSEIIPENSPLKNQPSFSKKHHPASQKKQNTNLPLRPKNATLPLKHSSSKNSSLKDKQTKIKSNPTTPTASSPGKLKPFAYLAKFISKKFGTSSSSSIKEGATMSVSNMDENGNLESGDYFSSGMEDREDSNMNNNNNNNKGLNLSTLTEKWNKSRHYFNPNYPIYISACLYGSIPTDQIPKSKKSLEDLYRQDIKEQKIHKANQKLLKKNGSSFENDDVFCSEESSPSKINNNVKNNLQLIEKSALPLPHNPDQHPEKYANRFFPKTSIPCVSEQDLSSYLYNSIILPNNIDRNEWIATNMIGLFKQIFIIYDAVGNFCDHRKNVKCREMRGVRGEKFYRQLFRKNFGSPGTNKEDMTCSSFLNDDRDFNTSGSGIGIGGNFVSNLAANLQTSLYMYQTYSKDSIPAPRYVNWVRERCIEIINNQDYFPTKYGANFGPDFLQTMALMAKWLYSVISHLYYAHFLDLLRYDNLHLYLNQVFVHLILFCDEFKLLLVKDRGSLADLLRFLVPKDSSVRYLLGVRGN